MQETPPRYVILEKEIGQTPLQAIEAWRANHPQWHDIPASYAGRLDPMASGTLLVLLGDECKQQTVYTSLDKQYEIETLLDLATDSGDLLGLATYSNNNSQPTPAAVKTALNAVRGAHQVPYPQFSSKTVNGKPLFLHTLEGTLSEIVIPEHSETLYRIQLLERSTISKDALRERIFSTLAKTPRSDEPSKKLGADFRIAAITKQWEELFATTPERTFCVLKLRVTCASGSYMRTLAGRIGTHLGTTGLALSIHRTIIGRYQPLPFWLGFWKKRF